MAYFDYEDKDMDSSVFGFDTYTTKDAGEVPVKPKVSITPSDILEKLQDLRRYLDSTSMEQFIRRVIAHIEDTGNPHGTDLDDFTSEIVDVLYKEYVKSGGDSTLAQYTEYLFSKIRVASHDEMLEMSKTLLVSVAGARQYFYDHEKDLEAHTAIVQHAFPGEPVANDPSHAVLGYVGANPHEISGDKTTVMSYVDIDGVLRFSSPGELPTDYWNGTPYIPCFGTKTNEFDNANDFSTSVGVNTSIGEAVDKKGPDNISTCTVITTGKDVVPVTHSLLLPEIRYATTKTFSIFAAAGTCRYLTLEVVHNKGMTVPTRAQFDLHHHTCICFNTLDNYSARIRKLANGWCRCELTVHHELGNTVQPRCIFHKDVTSVETATYQFKGENEICGYLFGMQLENSHRASPYIPTSVGKVTRQALGMNLDVKDLFTTYAVAIMTSKAQQFAADDKPLPLFTMLDVNNNPCCIAEMLYNGIIKIRHLVKVNTGDGWRENDLHIDYLSPSTDSTIKLVSSTGQVTIHCYNNHEGFSSNAPTYKVPVTTMQIGHCDTTYMDEYLYSCLVYSTDINQDQAKFLLGDMYE